MIINDGKNGAILYNGASSADFGMFVQKLPVLRRPERDGQTVYVPGRNGSIVIENGTYKNYVQPYEIAMTNTEQGVVIASRAVSEWLLNTQGYIRLEDSFEPDVYRMARFAGPLDIEQIMENDGKAVIEFDCMPQRYLKTGENEISIMTPYSGEGGSAPGKIKTAIPYGAVSMYAIADNAENNFFVYFLDENGRTAGEILDTETGTPSNVPDGAVMVSCIWNNVPSDFSAVVGMVNSNGDEIPICGVNGTSPIVFNPIDHEARPLLKFVDTSEEQPIVSQSIVVRDNTLIWQNGEVINWKPTWSGGSDGEFKTCEPVSVSGYAYAYVTGNSYAFYDGSGNALTFDADYYKTHQTYMDNTKVVVPSGASTIVIGTGTGAPNMSLSLQAARTNPGASAVTINGTTISLDFSVHDTIYLDCDWHDAYYIDGSSANDKVRFTSNTDLYPTFPGFVPGENTVIVRDGDNLDFSVVPRWWEL